MFFRHSSYAFGENKPSTDAVLPVKFVVFFWHKPLGFSMECNITPFWTLQIFAMELWRCKYCYKVNSEQENPEWILRGGITGCFEWEWGIAGASFHSHTLTRMQWARVWKRVTPSGPGPRSHVITLVLVLFCSNSISLCRPAIFSCSLILPLSFIPVYVSLSLHCSAGFGQFCLFRSLTWWWREGLEKGGAVTWNMLALFLNQLPCCLYIGSYL